MAAIANNNPKLDFKVILEHGGEEIRPYFLIGEKQASDANIQGLWKKMQCISEPIRICDPSHKAQQGYYRDFNLPHSFKGFALFVQKHLADDRDHSNNGNGAGLNILETYTAIQRVHPLAMENSAINSLTELSNKVRGYQEIIPDYLDMQPQLVGIPETLNSIQRLNGAPHQQPVHAKPAQEPQRAAASAASTPEIRSSVSMMQSEERKAAILETEEHIQTLSFLSQELQNNDPQKATAIKDLEKARAKLVTLQRAPQNQAKLSEIKKLEEEISSHTLIVELMGNNNPGKPYAVYNLQVAQHKLAELQR